MKDKSNNKNIGDQIAKVRKKRGLTQEQFAEKVKIAPTYLSNIERNNKIPSFALVRDIVKELDTSYDYIMINDFDLSKQLEIKYKEIYRDVSKLDKNKQEEFFNIMEMIAKSFRNM